MNEKRRSSPQRRFSSCAIAASRRTPQNGSSEIRPFRGSSSPSEGGPRKENRWSSSCCRGDGVDGTHTILGATKKRITSRGLQRDCSTSSTEREEEPTRCSFHHTHELPARRSPERRMRLSLPLSNAPRNGCPRTGEGRRRAGNMERLPDDDDDDDDDIRRLPRRLRGGRSPA